MTDLPARIRYFRQARGLTSRGLAKRLNCSHGAVSSWELGNATPPLPRLIALAEAFDTTLPEFLSAPIATDSN